MFGGVLINFNHIESVYLGINTIKVHAPSYSGDEGYWTENHDTSDAAKARYEKLRYQLQCQVQHPQTRCRLPGMCSG